MKKITILYHSGYGHTEKQAIAVCEGAREIENIEANLVKVEDIMDNIEDLNDSDAIIFGSPTYMGSASAEFKKFMDNSSSIWMKQQWKNKIAAGFTNSHSLGGDKLSTLIQLMIYAMQHSMIWVGLGHMNTCSDGNQGKIDEINRTGYFAGAVAQSDNQSPEITPSIGDLKTAKILGNRVAQITKKMQ